MDDTNGTKEKKYSWSFKDGKMNCCESETSTCNVSKLWEVGGLSAFHDAELQAATREINAILDGVRKTNREAGRELHFVQVEDRHLLAWVRSDLIGSHNDPQIVAKLLKLKPARRPARGGTK
jgi:hypothetical protein